MNFFEYWPPSVNCIVKPNNNGKSGIYLGNISSAHPQNLKTYNIRVKIQMFKTYQTVVSVIKMQNAEFEYKPDDVDHHLIIPADDIQNQDLLQYFNKAYEFIELHSQNTNVLVHCFAGISRSTTILIAYLMKKEKLTYQQAFSFVWENRKFISPNEGFQQQLKEWEQQLTNQLL